MKITEKTFFQREKKLRNLSYWMTEICLHSTFPPDNDSKAGGISLAGV
jgi:hypothetical protein